MVLWLFMCGNLQSGFYEDCLASFPELLLYTACLSGLSLTIQRPLCSASSGRRRWTGEQWPKCAGGVPEDGARLGNGRSLEMAPASLFFHLCCFNCLAWPDGCAVCRLLVYAAKDGWRRVARISVGPCCPTGRVAHKGSASDAPSVQAHSVHSGITCFRFQILLRGG